MDPIVKASGVNFTYNKGKDNEYHALININIEIYPEEYIIFYGPSGCGKSTLLNIVAGLETPDSGDIEVFGKNLDKMSARDFAMYHRSQVGMVFQQYNLITSLSVLDNVALPQMFVNVRKGRRNRWGRALLERFGILKQADKLPTELSGGQQQRIGVARAIVNNPKIVLADEPVGNLDSVSAKNVMGIFTDLNEKEKKTFIMVTHNPEHLSLADRIFYMKDGIITREVVNREKHKKKEEKGDPDSQEGFVKLRPPAMEIKDLMRAYNGLSPDQINILIMPYKAKIFAHHFITTRNMEETQMFEEVIQRRLLGTITEEEFVDILHRPFTEGGVGFDIRTAEKIIKRVNLVIKSAYYVYQDVHQRSNKSGVHEKITLDEKTEYISNYLLETCYGDHKHHLDETQINRLKTAVKERLEGTMQKPGFFEMLDKPFKKGGVGLNVKTAKAITEEIELVLILGFGIVQNKVDREIKALKEKEEFARKQKAEAENKEALQAQTKQIDDEQKMPREALQTIDDLVKKIKDEASGKGELDSEDSHARGLTSVKADMLTSREGNKEKDTDAFVGSNNEEDQDEEDQDEEDRDEEGQEEEGESPEAETKETAMLDHKMKGKDNYEKEDILSKLQNIEEEKADTVSSSESEEEKNEAKIEEVIPSAKPDMSLGEMIAEAQRRDEEAKK